MRPSNHTANGRIAEYRRWISTAQAEGIPLADLQLRLSLQEISELKRNRDVPTEEISFSGDVMRFMGVETVHSGSSSSSLERLRP